MREEDRDLPLLRPDVFGEPAPPSRTRRLLQVLTAIVVISLIGGAARIGGRWVAEESPIAWRDPVYRSFDAPEAPRLAAPGRGGPRLQIVEAPGVYLVPFDGVPRGFVARLGQWLARDYRIDNVRILPRMFTETPSFERDDGQAIAERIMSQIHASYQTHNQLANFVGITNLDMRAPDTQPGDRFSFGISGTVYGVISTARMDPRNFGRAPDPGVVERRARTMLARQLGHIRFQLPRSGSERSAMGPPIRGLEDLDERTPSYCPSRPRSVVVC